MRAHDAHTEHDAATRPAIAARSRKPHFSAASPASVAPLSIASIASIAAIQRSAGNAAAVQLVAQQRHAHGPGCGHGEETTDIQRSTVPDVLRSPGKPLDGEVRADMEARLGADFSDVRVHDDGAAQRSAAEVGARAYTSGSHVVIGRDGADRHTLAHELTHVIQQRSGPVAGTDTGSGLRVSDPSDRFERAAEANAVRALSGPAPVQRAGVVQQRPAGGRGESGAAVQRMPKDSGKKRAGKKSKGKTVAEALKSELESLGWIAHGASQSLTIHKPIRAENPSERSKAENLKGTAAARIYGDSANLKEPRSYAEEERSRQSTRWVTTLALNYLNSRGKAPEEVQATIHAAQLHISSNKNAANDALRALAEKTQTGTAFLNALIDDNSSESLDGRSERHRDKAGSRLTGKKEMSDGYQAIIGALSAKVEVPTQVDKEQDGLHAERRLAQALPRGAVTPDTTVGTKRPCVACYISLYQGTGVSPGPYWPSKAANVGMANYSLEKADMLALQIDTAVTQAGGTFASLELLCADHEENIANGVHWGYNTDSDSDASGDDAMDTSGA
ncbi:DUF4157 domain-containing protein [Streptomyces rishiriensis]|uniref:eCIS core domain-containing protein n=1 Tax=Streptomyces rishiriensis TaxID=68264 RepID=UPI0033D98101